MSLCATPASPLKHAVLFPKELDALLHPLFLCSIPPYREIQGSVLLSLLSEEVNKELHDLKSVRPGVILFPH